MVCALDMAESTSYGMTRPDRWGLRRVSVLTHRLPGWGPVYSGATAPDSHRFPSHTADWLVST
ncbi:hypothetical protein Ait01nite_013350 [Actinoplanes italicus]|nr:hypothetical protein Ait01nite_013350 [Actinoplanes italicus]